MTLAQFFAVLHAAPPILVRANGEGSMRAPARLSLYRARMGVPVEPRTSRKLLSGVIALRKAGKKS